MKFWKVLDQDGLAFHGGIGKWSLPSADGPGEWMPWIEHISPCESGYHLCREQDLIHWLGPDIYEAEALGKTITDDNKVVCQSARLLHKLNTWNDKTARLFACDCAWSVLHIFELEFPSDMRPRRAINAAYLYVNNLIDAEEMAAAWAAASNAARDTARAAVRNVARDAAWAAASNAAWAAARAVARDAAWAAASNAARAAARAAARDAAWAAAWDAAWAAAWAAARDAAWAAAWAAARRQQAKRLFAYLYQKGETHEIWPN